MSTTPHGRPGAAGVRAGDFTVLATDYAANRPGYSESVLRALMAYTRAADVADIGAGTGIWTALLARHGLRCLAIEPNDAMRGQGMLHTRGSAIEWRAGSAEASGLEDASVDWVTMASSFHWAEARLALPEFSRVLRPGGYLTVLWNPRDVEASELERRVEAMIAEVVPELRRVSSGSAKHARDYAAELVSTGHFGEVVLFEAKHEITMTRHRYLAVWRSVNDIQHQAGPERFATILRAIADLVGTAETVTVPYRTRAWTARKVR